MFVGAGERKGSGGPGHDDVRRNAHASEGRERDGTIALCQALAGIVEHERDVQITRGPIAQEPLQQQLSRRGFEQIVAAYDLGHALLSVVDHDANLGGVA